MPNDEQEPGRASIPQHVEHPSTYVVQDRSNQHELTRIIIQDRLVTALMGGVLPEQPDSARFERVLDVGCGTGGWLIDMAEAHPESALLIGVDISSKMVAYGREQAAAHNLGKRVEFHVMDALRMLEFPTNFFDLVNMRFGTGYLRKWDWSKLLSEFRRVARPGSLVRVSETDVMVKSTSPALTRLFGLQLEALYNAGHLFNAEQQGVTTELASLLERAGFDNIQTRSFPTEYHAGTQQTEYLIEDFTHIFRVSLPFLRKWLRVPEDYDELYQQMLSEIHQPDFVASGDLVTAWGLAPRI
ncbi:MAG TPA: class I SAM-dependent methyltransferase [Ktedonobacteraceae bacterium]|jgi:ubiquinone/menaquinone biosynthesis C-methylase UbiE